MEPFIETYTGRTFKPLEPEWSDVRIEDIAHALGNQCRYSGHSRFRYSVGEHSVRVSEAIEEAGGSYVEQMWGLLHDASEAYLVDLPTPLKATRALGDPYRAAESLLMAAICHRFGLPKKQPEIVGVFDVRLLATEVRDLMHGERDYWKKIKAEPLPGRIRPWADGVAEAEFLRRFRRLEGVT